MLPRSLRRLCLCLAALMSASIDQSSCHQSSSRRGNPSFSALSHHRFARRSPPRLSNHLRRRSIPLNETPSSPNSHVTSAVPTRWRRSINLDGLDSDYTSQSLDQQRDQAERMWEEFVASTDGEDLDMFSDCDDDEENTSNPVLLGSNDSQPSSSLTSVSDNANPVNQQPAKGQSNGSNHGEDQVKYGGQVHKPKETHNKKEDDKASKAQQQSDSKVQVVKKQDPDEEAETKKQQDAAQAETKKEEDQAEKDKEAAQSKKQQEAAQAEKDKEAAQAAKKEQDAAEAKKEQDAAEAKKEQDAAEAKKEQDAAEAKKEQDAAEAKKEQEEAAQKAKKDKDAYQVTDVKKIPGTSVTTGTATKPKDETYSSPPSSEEHSGDATFFTPDTGACGIVNTSSDYIVAVSHLLYDSFPSEGGNPNTNRICGKKIRAHYKGKTVDVSVTDRCEACDMYSLDFTESAFQQLGSKEEGRLHGMTWTFI